MEVHVHKNISNYAFFELTLEFFKQYNCFYVNTICKLVKIFQIFASVQDIARSMPVHVDHLSENIASIHKVWLRVH